jgi:hypothetical protein
MMLRKCATLLVALGIFVLVGAGGVKADTDNSSAQLYGITNGGGRIWACGSNETISVNDGSAWTTKHYKEKTPALLSIGFAISQPSFGYAVGSMGTMLVTQDGGETWTEKNVGKDAIYNAAFADEQHGMIVTAESVRYTADGGANWNDVPIGKMGSALEPFKYVLTVAELDSQRMAVMLTEGPADSFYSAILSSRDGGKTWKDGEPADSTITGLVGRDGEYWTFGIGGFSKASIGIGIPPVTVVYHSKDGIDWRSAPAPRKPLHACTDQGCLVGAGDGVGAGVDPFAKPFRYWTFAAEDRVSSQWAMSKAGRICSLRAEMECKDVSEGKSAPGGAKEEGILPKLTPPGLGTGENLKPQCITCKLPVSAGTKADEMKRESETKYNAMVRIDGTVNDVKIENAGLEKVAMQGAKLMKDWIFTPCRVNGVPREWPVQVRYHANTGSVTTLASPAGLQTNDPEVFGR